MRFATGYTEVIFSEPTSFLLDSLNVFFLLFYSWLSLLERTLWFQHMSGLLAASMTVCHTIERQGRPVLVHCSDGWDRTPQIVATAQLCLDPFYRTVEGFRTLVEREWLSFGHKFADRLGHGPGSDETNERCPVFLQWLDCVHQIHKQFPCSFEFSMGYLVRLLTMFFIDDCTNSVIPTDKIGTTLTLMHIRHIFM